MKIELKYDKKTVTNDKLDIVKSFIEFLNNELPLKEDVVIILKNESDEGMTTGSNNYGTIKVLHKNRMLIDVLRTLAHEWVHEHQYQYHRKKTKQDIGGPDEDEANSESGKLLKMFNKKNPDKEKEIYE